MTKVLFICLGNICRSTMAEFVLKDLVRKNGLEHNFVIESAGTSSEEVGNPVHHGTKAKLASLGISCDGKFARKLTTEDYDKFDYLICMDSGNIADALRIFGGDPHKKISLLLSFAGKNQSIKDPWYTGNFDETYEDVLCGLRSFLSSLNL